MVYKVEEIYWKPIISSPTLIAYMYIADSIHDTHWSCKLQYANELKAIGSRHRKLSLSPTAEILEIRGDKTLAIEKMPTISLSPSLCNNDSSRRREKVLKVKKYSEIVFNRR